MGSKRISKLALAAMLAFSLGSCAIPYGEPLKNTGERKIASIIPWKERKVAGDDAFEYIQKRMGYLIGGNTMVMMTVTNEGAKMDVRSKTRFDVGSAAAISADGYYLTAAHCVTNEPLKLVGYSGRTILWAPGVRVVWKGGDERPDLALIHVPVRPSGYFPMAGESEIQRGTQVLAGGLGGLKQSLSAGRILKVRSTEQKGVRWLDIHHDTPLEKGDSGGPIMDERGRLLGISSKGGAWSLQAFGKYWIDSRRSISVWIDPEKIRSLMEEDRKKHRKR